MKQHYIKIKVWQPKSLPQKERRGLFMGYISREDFQNSNVELFSFIDKY